MRLEENGSAVEGGLDDLSVVVPTYNERENVEPLLRGLDAVRREWGRGFEVLVVDDRSPDGTAAAFERLAPRLGVPVRVVERDGPRSLGRAIVEGIRLSRGDLVCVMDADLSHPPQLVSRLLAALDGADGAVASRYAPGGRISRWPLSRRLVSWGATALARVLTQDRCRDPVSGFFLFRRASLAGLTLTGIGDKPLVEILAQRPLAIHEVPYEFRDRQHGRSKLNAGGIARFARLVVRLSTGAGRTQTPEVGVRVGMERGTREL